MGTRGRGDPEDTSQKTEDFWKGTETTEREGVNNTACTEGQSACRAGSVEKLTLEAERLREMAEKTGTVEGGRNRAERAGQGICHHVFGSRDVDYITGEFGDVG